MALSDGVSLFLIALGDLLDDALGLCWASSGIVELSAKHSALGVLERYLTADSGSQDVPLESGCFHALASAWCVTEALEHDLLISQRR